MNAPTRAWFFPFTSAMLLVVWLLLNDTLAPGHLVLGGLLAIGIPLFTRRFWVSPATFHRPLRALRFAAVVLADIVAANFVVARQVLSSTQALRPGFVHVPLDASSEMAISAFASVISLTPGTVTVDVDVEPRPRHLLVHVLDLEDEAELVRTLKDRYEAPIMEILE